MVVFEIMQTMSQNRGSWGQCMQCIVKWNSPGSCIINVIFPQYTRVLTKFMTNDCTSVVTSELQSYVIQVLKDLVKTLYCLVPRI